jgi:hypothetical protein
MTTLAELLQNRDEPTIEALLISVLQQATIEGQPGVHFPVTDWNEGSFERTHMKMIATGMLDRENLIQYIAAGGFLQYATTLVDANGNLVEGWMELLAQSQFSRSRVSATFAQQVLTLTCTSGPGPYTRAAGTMIAYSPSTGNRYLNVASVTIPDGGSVEATFQAESPGSSQLDAAGSIVGLVTPLPGVSVNNSPTAGGNPYVGLTGSGTIHLTSTTITTNTRTVQISITQSGRIDSADARMDVTVFQGLTKTVYAGVTIAATYTQGDAAFALADGASGSTSFLAGDTWIIALPGSPLLQAGSDKESLTSLAQRCLDRWPSLSDVPTPNRLLAWIRECSATNVPPLGLSKMFSAPSDQIAGQENAYIAGATTTATPTQVAIVQGYVDKLLSLTESAVIYAAASAPIGMSGIVVCKRGTTAKAKAAAVTAWAAYLAALPIGGDMPGHLVRLEVLEDCIMNAGAYTVSGLALSGGSSTTSNGDVVIAVNSLATIAADPSTLTWQEVA